MLGTPLPQKYVKASIMDIYTREKRSEVMSKIRGKNTTPERKVRSLLHSLGYRFRLHRKDLPGKPDIVLPKYKAVIFVHGCFWHRHPSPECKLARLPKSRQEFWLPKLNRNRERDLDQQQKLVDLGWRVLVIWECELHSMEDVKAKVICFLGE